MTSRIDISIKQQRSGPWHGMVGKFGTVGERDILNYDECLVAAVKWAQELGHDSFSITTHPHPDFEEQADDPFRQDEYNKHVANDIGRLTERVEDIDRWADDMNERVSKRLDDLAERLTAIDNMLASHLKQHMNGDV